MLPNFTGEKKDLNRGFLFKELLNKIKKSCEGGSSTESL